MKRSYIVAGGTLLAVVLWMLSGLFFRTTPTAADDEARRAAPGVTRVEVSRFEAQPMRREVVVQGQTMPRYEVLLKAELQGEVTEVLAEKGQRVREGDTLLRLAANERPQRLAQARALLQQRELEYKAAQSLKAQGLQAERQLAEALSLLREAQLQLKNAELAESKRQLRAPFAGVIQWRHVAPGDFMQPGDPAYTLVSLDPLRIRGDVAEGEVGNLAEGMAATATLSNGVELRGSVNFIAPVAEGGTRTFALEMEADNPDSQQRAGMSATIRVPLETLPAHKVSPALLSLSDEGVLGLKSVNQEGVVQFHAVEILKSERDGMWLGGLPDEVELITVGQGFVREGDRVEVVSAEQ